LKAVFVKAGRRGGEHGENHIQQNIVKYNTILQQYIVNKPPLPFSPDILMFYQEKRGAYMTTHMFENPSNGYREEAFTGLTPLWALLFGPLHALYRGLWPSFIIGVIVIFTLTAIGGAAGGVIGLLGFSVFHAINAGMALEQKYKQKGWLPVKDGKATSFKPSPEAISEEETILLNQEYAAGKITLAELLKRKNIKTPSED
jgi:hypothetical protein